MRLVTANHSSYPRVGEGQKAQRLRRANARRETGAVTPDEHRAVVADYVGEVIGEQQDAGLDVVTDGLVYWYDLVSHPASRLDGIKINGLVRFFDTNTYVRQPEVVGAIGGTFGLAGDFESSRSSARAELKAVMTGPYTLARHSINTDGGDLTSLAMAYAEAAGADLTALAAAGATLVQIDEPSLLNAPDDIQLVRTALQRITENKGDVRVSLTTYFGDASAMYGELIRMPVDVIGFDLIYGPLLADLLATDPPPMPVALGAIDGRNTKLDDTDAVSSTVARIMDALGSRDVDEVHLQPSCGLEFLPRDRAKRKLERMREIKDAVMKART